MFFFIFLTQFVRTRTVCVVAGFYCIYLLVLIFIWVVCSPASFYRCFRSSYVIRSASSSSSPFSVPCFDSASRNRICFYDWTVVQSHLRCSDFESREKKEYYWTILVFYYLYLAWRSPLFIITMYLENGTYAIWLIQFNVKEMPSSGGLNFW